MTRHILTGLIAALALAAPANAASVPNPETIAQNLYPNSPCNGHRTIKADPAVAARGHWAEAGVNNTDLYALDCEIRYDPTMTANRHKRCIIYLHEAGHQAGLNHSTGIMSTSPPQYYEPCATLRERVIHQLENKPGVFNVNCGRQTGRVFNCRTEYENSPEIVRYRVRTRGEHFAITRQTQRQTTR